MVLVKMGKPSKPTQVTVGELEQGDIENLSEVESLWRVCLELYILPCSLNYLHCKERYRYRVISNEVAQLKDSKITDLAENWICCTYDPYK